MKARSPRCTISDGKLTMWLEEYPDGGLQVRSPVDSGLLTHASSIREAFVMARDALKALSQSQAMLMRALARSARRA